MSKEGYETELNPFRIALNSVILKPEHFYVKKEGEGVSVINRMTNSVEYFSTDPEEVETLSEYIFNNPTH